MPKRHIVRTNSISEAVFTGGKFDAIFPGWGDPRVVAVNCSAEGDLKVIADTSPSSESTRRDNQVVGKKEHHHVGLTTVGSVSIAGCDLLASCLYTAGVCTKNSGKLAPVGLALVAFMLYFFKQVYAEVVTAIPVNGGTYNVMLNTSTKRVASLVACLSILAYVATAIVSGFDAILYLSILWPQVDIRGATLIVLALFGCITICGVGESAAVATTLVGVHMLVLLVLIIWSLAYGIQDNFQIFHDNIYSHFPPVVDSAGTTLAERSPGAALYFGYSSAMLGITGFETASNYVEEMESPAVFVSTVNGMWILVSFFNPMLSFMSLMVLPLPEIYAHPSEMLAIMADRVGGPVFKTILCVDAVTILCGGVLTSIVGVSGLLKRLANDLVMPKFLAQTNSRGAAHMAIITFVIVSMSLFLAIFNPDEPKAIGDFGGVFAISFLSVLVAFAAAAVLLKLYRARLARMVIAKWWHIILSLCAVSAGLLGNIILTPTVFELFVIYLSGFLAVVIYMSTKVEVFSFGIWMLRKMNLSDEKLRQARETDLAILEACARQAQFDERKALLSEPQPEVSSTADASVSAASSDSTAIAVAKPVVPASPYRAVSRSDHGVEMLSPSSPSSPSSPKSLGSRRQSFDEEQAIKAAETLQFDKDEDIVTRLMVWGESLVSNVRKKLARMPSKNLALPQYDTRMPRTVTEMEQILRKRPMMGKVLKYFMTSLDNITSAPFVYLCKKADPISIHRAVSYISNNEMTNLIYVVHFVDDRKAIRLRHAFLSKAQQQVERGRFTAEKAEKYSNTLLMQMFQDGSDVLRATMAGEANVDGVRSTADGAFAFDVDRALKSLPSEAKKLVEAVAILDAFYTYKKIHCIIVRGAFFCPSALDCLSEHIGVAKNSMIMGVPDMKFNFPFAKLNGVRLSVSAPDPVLASQASAHMYDVLSAQFLSEQAQRKAALDAAEARAERVRTNQTDDDDGKCTDPSVSGDGLYEV